jgi:hypothetical protein
LYSSVPALQHGGGLVEVAVQAEQLIELAAHLGAAGVGAGEGHRVVGATELAQALDHHLVGVVLRRPGGHQRLGDRQRGLELGELVVAVELPQDLEEELGVRRARAGGEGLGGGDEIFGFEQLGDARRHERHP